METISQIGNMRHRDSLHVRYGYEIAYLLYKTNKVTRLDGFNVVPSMLKSELA